MKTYKLIKIYPGSPKLGVITWTIKKDNIDYFFFDTKNVQERGEHYPIRHQIVENNPEFWQEVIEKDYEILSIEPETTKPCGEIYNIPKNFDYPLKKGDKIISVKRLSDGEVFTVKDKCTTGIIKAFQILHNNCRCNFTGGHSLDISYLEHIKKPLFTTEDGVEIFEGDTYWRNSGWARVYKAEGGIGTRFCLNDKPFSTEKLAEEYIILNRPCLSIQDLLDAKIASYLKGKGLIYNRILQIVKSKL